MSMGELYAIGGEFSGPPGSAGIYPCGYNLPIYASSVSTMNRPVIGTISILALLGGGLYFAWNYKDAAPQTTRASYEGAAARSAIQSWLDLALPNSASQ